MLSPMVDVNSTQLCIAPILIRVGYLPNDAFTHFAVFETLARDKIARDELRGTRKRSARKRIARERGPYIYTDDLYDYAPSITRIRT